MARETDLSGHADGDIKLLSDTELQKAYAEKRRQAVLVIHGMGEQTPLGTLKDFVRSIYQRDTNLTSHKNARVDDAELGVINRVWMVPDDTTGSNELRRITTSPNKNKIVTDFYEFYWADILHGNPLDLVIAWIQSLLLRSPFRVPRDTRVWIAWLTLWAAAILFFILSGAIAEPEKGHIAAFVAWVVAGLNAPSVDILGDSALWPSLLIAIGIGLIGLRALLVKPLVLQRFEFGIALLLEGLALWALLPIILPLLPLKFAGVIGLWAIVTGAFVFGFRLMTTVPVHKTKLLLPTGLIIVGAVLLLVPVTTYANPLVVAGAMASVSGAFVAGFLVPYFGDVVRYTRVSPATVAKREAIRERGLKLLRNLHGLPENGGGEPDGPPKYERVVVVAHSLGSMIAYDLLLHFWEEIGPNHKRPNSITSALEKALKDMDTEVVQKTWVKEFAGESAISQTAFDALNFHDKQAAVFDALKVPSPWRISDLITVGSPLVHSEFLSFYDRDGLQRSFSERTRASSPPTPDWPRPSMLYKPKGGRFHPHFAAPFAAVKWTNIYDKHWFPLLGDIVSGPARAIFGPGVKDVPVAITREGALPPINRIATHTQYWNQPVDGEVPDWIVKLRDAVALEGEP